MCVGVYAHVDKIELVGAVSRSADSDEIQLYSVVHDASLTKATAS